MQLIRSITPEPYQVMGISPYRSGQIDLPIDARRGLRLWLDANQIPNIYDGDKVTTWPDVSGNGKDFSQAVTTSQPTFQTGGLNGYPVVDFDGSDVMTHSSLSEWNFVHQGLGATILCVANRDGAAISNVKWIFSSARSSAQTGWGIAHVNSTSTIIGQMMRGVAGQQPIAIVGAGAWATGSGWHALMFDDKDQPGDDAALFLDGKELGSQEKAFPYSVGNATHNLHLGGQDDFAINRWEGPMAELAIWDRVLTRPERAGVLDYIRLKYGLWLKGDD